MTVIHEIKQSTVQQYNVLRILNGAGTKGLPTLEIAQRMIEQTPGITRLIDRLQHKNLVARERGSSDRRCIFCRITPDGSALVATLDRPVRAAADGAFRGITKKELAHLVESLDRLRQSISINRKEEE